MHRRLIRSWRGIAVLAAGLFIAVTAACGDGDGEASAEEIQEVEDTVRQLFESSGEEADFVFQHVTDNLIETVFFSNREECEANAAECIGEPAVVESISGTEIDGDTATTTVAADFGTFDVGLVREDGAWKANSLQATSDEVPGGAASVDLALSEFAFTFDDTEIPGDGNFAFHVTNEGAQPHEVAVAPIPAEGDPLEALETIDESSVAGFKLFIQPGQEVDMAFDAPLEPGRYVLVCFFPNTADEQGTPHVELGMISEFTVQ